MTIKDRLAQPTELRDMHNGSGLALVHFFFHGQISSGLAFAEAVWEPRAYAGYHRHAGNDEIIYVISGRAENYQDGDRCILEPGDAMLTKSGDAHAVRNVGDGDLRILGVIAPHGDESAIINLPQPEEISDWE